MTENGLFRVEFFDKNKYKQLRKNLLHIPKSEQTINKRFNFVFMFSKNACIYF